MADNTRVNELQDKLLKAMDILNAQALNSISFGVSKDRITLAIVTNAIADQSFFEMVSLKNINAISEVATISKLFISETLAAFEYFMPNISKIGAPISRTTIIIVYGSSFFVSGFLAAVLLVAFKTTPQINRPKPAPRYKNAAIIIGGIWFRNIFEKGIPIAYSAAARIAYAVARYFAFMPIF